MEAMVTAVTPGDRPARAMFTLLSMAVAIGLVIASGARADESAASPLFERAEVVLVPYAANPAVVVDGKIAAGEYSSIGEWTDPSGLRVDWVWNGTSVFLALSGSTLGWMAVGFSSDLDQGMGFLVIAASNGTPSAVVRYTTNVSGDAAFSAPTSGTGVVEASNLTQRDGVITAEFRLAANTTLWNLQPGEVVPTILAFNRTSAAVPSGLAGSAVRFLRAYFLRPQDNPQELQRLFMEQISPVQGLVGVGVMGTGVLAILATFVRRKAVR